jgi:hypothetical protein
MHAVVRTYSGKGAEELFDVLAKHTDDVERIMREVKGFVSYTLIHTGDGGISVTVCEDKTGTDESLHKARDWITRNAASTGVGAPVVLEGRIVMLTEHDSAKNAIGNIHS